MNERRPGTVEKLLRGLYVLLPFGWDARLRIKRALFLEEAARALNSRGISQTSLADLAQTIGVSRAAL